MHNIDIPHYILLFFQVTNEKLNMCSEMVEILRSHLNERHSLRLEWAIVALIAIEVTHNIYYKQQGQIL